MNNAIVSEHQICYEEMLKLADAHNRLVEVIKRLAALHGDRVLLQNALDVCRVNQETIHDLLTYRQVLDRKP